MVGLSVQGRGNWEEHPRPAGRNPHPQSLEPPLPPVTHLCTTNRMMTMTKESTSTVIHITRKKRRVCNEDGLTEPRWRSHDDRATTTEPRWQSHDNRASNEPVMCRHLTNAARAARDPPCARRACRASKTHRRRLWWPTRLPYTSRPSRASRSWSRRCWSWFQAAGDSCNTPAASDSYHWYVSYVHPTPAAAGDLGDRITLCGVGGGVCYGV